MIRHKFDSTEVEYFVECKYRSTWNETGCVDLNDRYSRYHNHAKEQGKELFIALGVGGTLSAPEELLLIPGRKIGYDHLIHRKRSIKCLCDKSPAAFHNYFAHYFRPRKLKK